MEQNLFMDANERPRSRGIMFRGLHVDPEESKVLDSPAFNARNLYEGLDDTLVDIWRKLGLLDRFLISEELLRTWMAELREGYNEDLPYSNFASAVQWSLLSSRHLNPHLQCALMFRVLSGAKLCTSC